MSGSRFTPGAAATERARRLRRIWRAMTADERVLAIRAAGRDGRDLVPLLRAQLSKTLNVRPVTVQGWGVEKIADQTVRAPLGDDVLADLLIAFHLAERVPLLSAFLDAAGIPHTQGATDDADVEPDAARVEAAAEAVAAEFPEHDRRIYFATLLAMEGDAWAPLRSRVDESLAG